MSSIDPEVKSITSPNANLCAHHHCSSCIGYNNPKSVANTIVVADTIAANAKKPKLQIKKPSLKSIILSTKNIKREIDEDFTIELNSIPMTKIPEIKIQPIDMQFTDTKKQINSYFKSNDNFVQQNQRSYSPPLPVNHRLASMVSSDTSNAVISNNQSRRSNSSRDRKCSKKRKKQRRSYSRDSRSKSR